MIMEKVSGEQYLISKAKMLANIDKYAAKSWILAAKTIYPNDFTVQFEAYLIEKQSNNYEEAAKCFSYILLTFPNQPIELWTEITQLTSTLRLSEGNISNDQEFYVKMFQYITYEVQHKILLLTANHSDNNLEHCRLILLLLKRFPQAISTHAPRLLETIIQGVATQPDQFREMLVLEALPLIFFKAPELPNHLIHSILAISFEYYMKEMLRNEDDTENIFHECWRKIFDVLEVCGKIIKWEPFIPYKKTISKEVYWQKIIKIVSSVPARPSENKQILFCATIVFLLSLQEYLMHTKIKMKDTKIDLILVEGLKDLSKPPIRKLADGIEVPNISFDRPCTEEVPICLITAANCWQLLHSNDILQMDFSQLIMTLPVSGWINRFLLDLTCYLGRSDETFNKVVKEPTSKVLSSLEKNIRLLSSCVGNGTVTVQSFEYVINILPDLPAVVGTYTNILTSSNSARHLILLPMTRKSILQYCVKILINNLYQKVISDPNCNDSILGNLLVLTQIDLTNESKTIAIIFDLIRNRRSFFYLLFPNYIINVDIIEEFMHIWLKNSEIKLEFVSPQNSNSRRIGTRGADKNVKEDFKQIIKQQIARCNDDIDSLIIQFIHQEKLRIIQNIYEK